MNPNQNTTQKHQSGTMEYAAQRELAGRLAYLNGFIGSPVPDPAQHWHRDHIDPSRRCASGIRFKAIAGMVGMAWRNTVAVVASLLEKRRQRYILRQNIAELRAMNDRTLNDIGLVRGDLGALSTGAVTTDELNRKRSLAGSHQVRLRHSAADAKPASQPASGHCTALVDRAA